MGSARHFDAGEGGPVLSVRRKKKKMKKKREQTKLTYCGEKTGP